LRVTHYPIDSRGFVCQGYFFPFDLRGLSLILSLVAEDLPDWLERHRPGRLLLPEDIAESPALTEGAVSRITVNAYERNPEARWCCIEHYVARCVVCEFDFGKEYGEVAEGRIHVHHLTPLSEIGKSYKVNPIKDLRPVCPNCHAVIHLGKGLPYTIEEVKSFRSKAGDGRLRQTEG
jgi:5-methylcytosine-specific restriction protein A